jgi:hypothetical protein
MHDLYIPGVGKWRWMEADRCLLTLKPKTSDPDFNPKMARQAVIVILPPSPYCIRMFM